MEKWKLIETIRYLKELNNDPVQKESVKRDRRVHIEHYENLLREIEKEENNEIRD